ncbi:hypothetical protein pqer_cds_340 [Pandoravirus quercus]|uniref:Uncharacterized protein n=2 Tax=Pandoravirus TaxID=2060084 RepID=A0A2U7U8Q1_9VIRU|nr:hypothetical protein pqer_cds_340 [Pandoravirus quercus]AVK74762.1 hypothetical protein pqer_cds_340 [Pandoravirus quercus]QBZ80939.1 hypothetical protein pclt_cds_341 [Pandoravirus celtis]
MSVTSDAQNEKWRKRLDVDPGAAALLQQSHAQSHTVHHLCSPTARQLITLVAGPDGSMVVSNAAEVAAFLGRDFKWDSATLRAHPQGIWLHVYLDDPHYGHPYIQVVTSQVDTDAPRDL